MKFSIFVVSLNAGEELLDTISSVLEQRDVDLEVIVKDGGSTDGSLSALPADDRIQLHVQKDTGIYDAMNQAIEYAGGDYGLFMNCGDKFYGADVLRDVASYIEGFQEADCVVPTIYYGDCYTGNRGYVLRYPEVFDDYICFTKTLCHQATIYPVTLLKHRRFASGYRIAADFEYYINAYRNGYTLRHIPIVIAYYQGNGTSESSSNRKIALAESSRALKSHYTSTEYRRIYMKVLLRGGGIKRFLVSLGWLYPLYSRLATLYHRKKEKG